MTNDSPIIEALNKFLDSQDLPLGARDSDPEYSAQFIQDKYGDTVLVVEGRDDEAASAFVEFIVNAANYLPDLLGELEDAQYLRKVIADVALQRERARTETAETKAELNKAQEKASNAIKELEEATKELKKLRDAASAIAPTITTTGGWVTVGYTAPGRTVYTPTTGTSTSTVTSTGTTRTSTASTWTGTHWSIGPWEPVHEPEPISPSKAVTFPDEDVEAFIEKMKDPFLKSRVRRKIEAWDRTVTPTRFDPNKLPNKRKRKEPL